MKRLLAATLLPLIAFVDCGFADSVKYKIGVIAPLSGGFASYGAMVREGIESVQRPDIEWVFEDEACEPAKAISAFKKLTAVDRVQFIIGPCCGSPQKAVAPLLPTQETLVLLPNAAPESVFYTSGKRMYSAQYSLEADGTFMANAVNKRGIRRVAIVANDNDFSRAIEQAFTKSFTGSIVLAEHAPGFDSQLIKATALKLKTAKFDALFVPDAGPLLLGLLTEMHKLGIPKRAVFSIYAAQMKDVLAAEGENAEGLIYSYPVVPEGEDAFGHFPALAARTMASAVSSCSGDFTCVQRKFASELKFKHDGTLQGAMILKTIKKGEFVPLAEDDV